MLWAGPATVSKGGAFGDDGAVLDPDIDGQPGVVAAEHVGGDFDAGDVHGLARVHVEMGLGVRVDHQLDGQVAIADVLLEPEVDQALDGKPVIHYATPIMRTRSFVYEHC